MCALPIAVVVGGSCSLCEMGLDILNAACPFWYDLTMPSFDPLEFQHQFFRQCPTLEPLLELFDALPQTFFYAKNRDSRFVKVNQPFVENHGLENEERAIGMSDRDLNPPLLAEAYIEEDRRVMASGKTLPGQVWLVLHRRRFPRWYVSTKTPLLSSEGEVIGIAGAMYRIEHQEQLTRHFQELLPVVRYIEKHYAESISMAEMANLAGVSSTHFNRRFRQLLRMTPMAYLRTVRVQAAQQMLTTSSRTLSEIALAVGFTDQSHFTRRFRETTGMTPHAYRQRFVR